MAGYPAPGRKILPHPGVGGSDLEDLSRVERAYEIPELQQDSFFAPAGAGIQKGVDLVERALATLVR